MSAIDAPGTVAPCASLTVPDTVPVTPWAAAEAAMAVSARNTATSLILMPYVLLTCRPGRRRATQKPHAVVRSGWTVTAPEGVHNGVTVVIRCSHRTIGANREVSSR